MIIDVHCHYALSQTPLIAADRFSFESESAYATVGAFDACVAPRAAGRLAWRCMKRLLGVDPFLEPGPQLDAALREAFVRHTDGPGEIARYVLLAFDHYHDNKGEIPPLPMFDHQLGSDMYTSNSLVRELCRQHPDRYLFGASVHPYRIGAPEWVEEVFRGGASLLKWIPLHQNINAKDDRTIAVFEKCAEIGLPLLLHYNEEFTLAMQHDEWRPIRPLLETLHHLKTRGCMPTVIIAHVATPVTPLGLTASYHDLLHALRTDFASAPLYADISALTTWGKVAYLRELARMQDIHHKLLFGSDFPVPLALPRLRRELGRDYRRIAQMPSWPEQALAVFRRAGFNEIIFHRAAEILPNCR